MIIANYYNFNEAAILCKSIIQFKPTNYEHYKIQESISFHLKHFFFFHIFIFRFQYSKWYFFFSFSMFVILCYNAPYILLLLSIQFFFFFATQFTSSLSILSFLSSFVCILLHFPYLWHHPFPPLFFFVRLSKYSDTCNFLLLVCLLISLFSL